MIISRKSFLPYFCPHPRYPLLVFIYTGASMRSLRIASLRYRPTTSGPHRRLSFNSAPSPLRRYRVIQVGRQAGKQAEIHLAHIGARSNSGEVEGERIVTFDSWCKSSDVIKSDCKMYRGPARYISSTLHGIFVRRRRRGVMHVC